MIDIYMEDFRAVSPSERVDIGKRITMLLEKLQKGVRDDNYKKINGFIFD